MFNVFIDRNGSNVATLSVESAYDASALVHAYLDEGYSVSSDLWSAYIPDAVITAKILIKALHG